MAKQARKRNTEIIAVCNQKGGVGKTTTTANLAAALGEKGRKVLIVDLDSNTSSTAALGVPDIFMGSCEMMLGIEDALSVIVSNDPAEEIDLPKNVELICGRRNLDSIEQEMKQVPKFKVVNKNDALLEPLEELNGSYDYIFLDTAPNTNIPTRAAYKAAKFFLLASMPQSLAVAGLNAAMEDIADFRKYGNPDAEVLGVVLSNVEGKPTLSGNQAIKDITNSFPKKAGPFNAKISRSVIVHRCQAGGKTVFQIEPKHKVAEEYRALATELEQRIKQRRGDGDGKD